MKITTEYNGRIQVFRKYNSHYMRHGDRRKEERRKFNQSVERNLRDGIECRNPIERRVFLREPRGVIHVYGILN